MAQSVLKTLEARNDFLEHLDEDIKKNNQFLEDTKKQQQKLQDTITDLKILGTYPEHTAFIPLAKNIYMKGKIVHTGECHVKKTVSPESYIVLKSLEQALDSIQNEANMKEKDIEKIKYATYQLEERKKLLKGETEYSLDEDEEEEELPKEIKSDKGVAVRVGEYYEIMEFEGD